MSNWRSQLDAQFGGEFEWKDRIQQKGFEELFGRYWCRQGFTEIQIGDPAMLFRAESVLE